MKPFSEHAHCLAPIVRIIYLYLLLHLWCIFIHIFDYLVYYVLGWTVDSRIKTGFLDVVCYLLLKVDAEHFILRTTTS